MAAPEGFFGHLITRQRSLATPAILFVVLLVLSAWHGPHIFTSDGLAGAVIGAAPLVLATLAITPIAVAGPAGVDLSIGPVMTFINIVIVLGLPELGLSDPAAVFGAAILLGVVLQAMMGALIGGLRVSTVVVTLAVYLVLNGLNTVILPEPGGTAPEWLSNFGAASSILSPILYVPVAAFVLWALITRTTFFRNVRLMGANDRTAFVSGVPLIPTRIGAHVIAGVFTGVASVMYTGLIGSADPTAGASYTLSAITALVIGGASLSGGQARGLGSVLGGIDIWLISYVLSTFNFGLNASYWVEFATGAVLVAALVMGGFLGGLGRRRPGRARRAAPQ
ncbi:MAG: ABC transporter permease [Acetobacteraceae bacterium]